MAVQIARPAEELAEQAGSKGFGQKVRDFFSTIAELVDIYVNSPRTLDYLDSEYRARLSGKEKADMDAGLLGIWRS